MTLFIAPQYTASFSQEPHVGYWLTKKFYQWKIDGVVNPRMFGRDKPDDRASYANLWHAHIIPSKKEEQDQWVLDANKGVDPYDLTSDRFILYAKHEDTKSFLLLKYYKDPGAHESLKGYFGNFHDNFNWALQIPEGTTTYPASLEKSA